MFAGKLVIVLILGALLPIGEALRCYACLDVELKASKDPSAQMHLDDWLRQSSNLTDPQCRGRNPSKTVECARQGGMMPVCYDGEVRYEEIDPEHGIYIKGTMRIRGCSYLKPDHHGEHCIEKFDDIPEYQVMKRPEWIEGKYSGYSCGCFDDYCNLPSGRTHTAGASHLAFSLSTVAMATIALLF